MVFTYHETKQNETMFLLHGMVFFLYLSGKLIFNLWNPIQLSPTPWSLSYHTQEEVHSCYFVPKAAWRCSNVVFSLFGIVYTPVFPLDGNNFRAKACCAHFPISTAQHSVRQREKAHELQVSRRLARGQFSLPPTGLGDPWWIFSSFREHLLPD